MELTLTTAHEPEPRECPTCHTPTTEFFLISQAGHEDRQVCPACLHDEVISYTDGRCGWKEWVANGAQQLTHAELLHIVDTEFIRDAGKVRLGPPHPSRLAREHNHRHKLTQLVDDGKLAQTAVGVDAADAVFPSPPRRARLINTHDLLSKWDISVSARQNIVADLEEHLDSLSQDPSVDE